MQLKTGAQWLSGRVLEGPRVRASPASLRCGPWARHIYPSLVLVQPRKNHPYITERLLMGRKESNQTNKQTKQLKTEISRPTSKKATYHLINHPGFECVPTGGRVLDFIAFMPWALLKFTHWTTGCKILRMDMTRENPTLVNVNNKGTCLSSKPRSLISDFTSRLLESISTLASSKISFF